MDPVKEFSVSDKQEIILTIPAMSISAFTNINVTHDKPAANR
jgi:hypothetical protein